MDLISTVFLGVSFFLVLGLCWAVVDPIFAPTEADDVRSDGVPETFTEPPRIKTGAA